MSSNFIAYYRKVVAVIWLVTLIFHASSAKETNKPGTLGTYCYDAFVAAWRHCCGNRYPGCVQAALNDVKQVTQGRRKRDVGDGKDLYPCCLFLRTL